MLTKQDIIKRILQSRVSEQTDDMVEVFAPSNIALVKYWGKRNETLNLPQTSSLSITLPDKGSTTKMYRVDGTEDEVIINGVSLSTEHPFAKKASAFLDFFRPYSRSYYCIDSTSNIPIAAGLASSASGFAALVQALDFLHQWDLSESELSILARMGSGSACRSLWNGFVEWQCGEAEDGMDSHGFPIDVHWPGFKIGLAITSSEKKSIGSREGMIRTTKTSPLYSAWPEKVAHDLVKMKQAINARDFSLLGEVAESNALTMHATMISAWPPLLYWQPETVSQMQLVWTLRQQGIQVYFTQDAGPNLKLLFLEENESVIQEHFPNLDIVSAF